MNNIRIEYLRVLETWVQSALKDIYTPPERPDLACYGSGYNSWGVQTNQKALATLAVLATDPELDESRTGMSREALTELALKLLRFSLESHITGGYHCTDGESWGHTWISGLGIERMMHGVEELHELMSAADHELLRRVLISESDWLTDAYRRAGEPGVVRAGLVEHNDPESNLWNGILLQRTAMMYPDARRRAEYLRQGTKFILNGISIEADAGAQEMFDGQPLAAWHAGANFFPSYALNHHRYMNLGYMVICLSQVAMAHFAWKKRGKEMPAAMYHHVRELWQVVKKMTFPDGRLARIGGDTRARYCYCQDYAVPTWMLMLDLFGDCDCEEFERRWLKTVRGEIATGTGSAFLSTRLAPMADISPTYYTRLESDRAVSLSMALCWRRLGADFKDVSRTPAKADLTGEWADEYHGASFVRGRNRLASFTWRAAEPPQGLCVPVHCSDMAEWSCNLSARLLGGGAKNTASVVNHAVDIFKGGFINTGTCEIRSEQHLAEGEKDKTIAIQRIAFAALPDDATVVGIQYATAVNRTFLRSVKGINYMLPNDIFNGGSRRYCSGGRKFELNGPSAVREVIDTGAAWLNVDDVLTIVNLNGENLRIFRPGARQIEIRDKPFSVSSLHADEICWPCLVDGVKAMDHGEVIVDTAFAIRCGEDSAGVAERLAAGTGKEKLGRGQGFRAVTVIGADQVCYLLVFNLRDAVNQIQWRPGNIQAAALQDIVTGDRIKPADSQFRIPVKAGSGRIFALQTM